MPTGTLRLPWLRFFHAFSSVVNEMQGYNLQRRSTARTLLKLIVLFRLLSVCKCVLHYCHWVSIELQLTNTEHFIMFSVITNIYDKKTKGPTLMEFFTATGKLKKFFLTTRDVRCVHHRWHGTHRYDIQVLATHMSMCWRVCGKNSSVWQELEYRIDMCRVTRGAHIKRLQLSKKTFSVFLWLWKIPLR
jgi:hypothetical protein